MAVTAMGCRGETIAEVTIVHWYRGVR
jgi:hypothetical protein